MDTVSKATRSKIMASVGRQNTGPEIRLREALHKLGLKYRLNCRDFPGSPDMVLPKYKAIIFVHGCFWHAHACKFTSTPSSRKKFWTEKFKTNHIRDKQKINLLMADNWRVLVLWECAFKRKNEYEFGEVLSMVMSWLNSKEQYGEIIGR